MIKMTFRGGDACLVGYTETQKKRKEAGTWWEGLQRRREKEKRFFSAALENSSHPYRSQKKDVGVIQKLCIKCPDAFQNRSVLFPAYKSWNRGKGSVCKR